MLKFVYSELYDIQLCISITRLTKAKMSDITENIYVEKHVKKSHYS